MSNKPPKKRTFHEDGQSLTLRAVTQPDGTVHHELMIGHVPILTSKALGTERVFGELAAKLVPSPKRVLIGGLGFGSTLAGVLSVVGADARVIVVEKLKTVVRLARGELAHLTNGALDDPRVTLVRDDVGAVIERERDLDVILLDVDNGPEWASFAENSRLYDARGLACAHAALRSSGAYAVWSGYPYDAFVGALGRAGFNASVVPLHEDGKVAARAYVGRKR